MKSNSGCCIDAWVEKGHRVSNTPISPSRILILDDHAACREAWQLLCEELWPAAAFLHAPTLAAALAHTDVDLVLADLTLPDSQPRQTVTSLVEALPITTPLVLLSGSVAKLEGYELLRLGADAFVSKGTDTEEVIKTLYASWLRACGLRMRMQAWAVG